MTDHQTFYLLAAIVFVASILIRIILNIRAHSKSRREENKRFFQLGLHEGSNRMYYAQKQDKTHQQIEFEEYLAFENHLLNSKSKK